MKCELRTTPSFSAPILSLSSAFSEMVLCTQTPASLGEFGHLVSFELRELD